MKARFVYGYKTPANETCEGSLFASSRDEAFRLLKAQGIRPYRVALAPGFPNRLRALGWRVYSIVALVVALVLVAVMTFRQSRTIEYLEFTGVSPVPRHQIYGDPALMEELARTDYAIVFTNAGDRVLARFAQPGHKVAVEDSSAAADLAAALSRTDDEAIVFSASDAREVRELKRIVLWIRGEARRYLSNGVGTPERYLKRLHERQRREQSIFYQAQNDINRDPSPLNVERINNSLRNIGLQTIVPSEK